MYQLKFLERENDLNKIIKSNKRRGFISILFVSLWDKYSSNILDKVKKAYKDSKEGEPLYIVDSFNMPHSFVIYNTTKVPHLIQLRRGEVLSEDYLPTVMKALKIS